MVVSARTVTGVFSESRSICVSKNPRRPSDREELGLPMSIPERKGDFTLITWEPKREAPTYAIHRKTASELSLQNKIMARD
jgi:hypothetical protein